jgi:hypothetical protein
MCIAARTDNGDISGLYVSKDPNFNERISIMYVRGYKNFLYTPPNEDSLQLFNDNTFIHINNYCKGVDKLKGKWKYEKSKLSLQYSDTSLYKNTSFKVLKNKLYRIDDAVLSENNKKVKHLALYKKQ